MRYLLRRLLYLPLSLLLLVSLCFALSRAVPPLAQDGGADVAYSRAYLDRYRAAAEEADRVLPLFYFSVANASLPDTLHHLAVPAHRELVTVLATRCGNWPAVQTYYRELLHLAYPESNSDDRADDRTVGTARRLLATSDPTLVAALQGQLRGPRTLAVRAAYAQLQTDVNPWRTLLPRLYWHGAGNQYHRYLSRLLSGDLGQSLTDRRSVAGKVRRALSVTLLLNGLALLLVYLLAVPLGMYMAQRHGTRFDRWATALTFLGFGIPSFWVATLLANFLTTPAFGMDLFPSMGLGEPPPDAGLLSILRTRIAHLLLPVCCLTYPSLAYVARHLRTSALNELQRPYVDTARMKGLSEHRVLWGHVFRNAAFPLITLLGSLLPALLAGSVLVELIFNLPGMGRLLYTSALARDWPVVTALVLLNGLVTVIGLLLADVAYTLTDPRVRLGKSSLR